MTDRFSEMARELIDKHVQFGLVPDRNPTELMEGITAALRSVDAGARIQAFVTALNWRNLATDGKISMATFGNASPNSNAP